MPYDFFSNARQVGPQIDTDLFARAAQQGAETGKTIGSPIASLATGLEQGVQSGLQDVGAYEQNQIREQQLEQAQLQTQIAELNTKNTLANNDLQQQAVRSNLQVQVDQNTQADKDLQNQNAIGTILASKNSANINGIWSNPDYVGTLLRHPDFADRAVGEASGSLTSENFATAYKALGYAKAQSYNLDIAKLNAEYASKMYSALSKDQGKIDLPATLNSVVTTGDVPLAADKVFSTDTSGLRVFETGTVEADKGRLLTNPDGSFKPSNISANELNKLTNKDINPYPFDVYLDGQYQTSISKADADKYNTQRADYLHNKALIGQNHYGITFNGVPGMPSILNIQGLGIVSPTSRAQPTATAAPSQLQQLPANAASSSNYQPATSQGTQPQGAGIGVAAGMSAGGSPLPAASAAPTAVPQNQDIVDQNKADFTTRAGSPPPGIPQGALQSEYQKTYNSITQRNSLLAQQKLGALGASKSITNAAISTNTPTPAPDVAPTPSAALSQTLKQNVDFTFETPSLKSSTYTRVNSDPLTQNLSPLFKGVVATESGGVRGAVSPTGVQGLAQVQRSTAAQFGLNSDIPSENLLAGQLYLTQQLSKFDGNLRLALAAYNAGPGYISDAVRSTGTTDWNTVLGYLKDNLSARKYKEVSSYPDRVLSYATQFMGQSGDSDLNLAYMLQRNGLIKPKAQIQSGV